MNFEMKSDEVDGSQAESNAGGAWLALFRSMQTAREIDRIEAEYVRRGLAFFHVSGAGHESSAALTPHLTPDDWLHCHYRDKALLVMRGVPIREFFLSLLCKAGSHSNGRQMSAHLSCPALNVLSIVGPVGNNALQAVGVASELKRRGKNAIVVCSVGDGTTQEGEYLEAVAEAVRERLPVLFLIEDNRWAISTPTCGKTFFSRPDGPASEFYGLPIHRVDGRHPTVAYSEFGRIVGDLRSGGAPALVWLQVERLTDHSNADDQRVYRAAADIQMVRAAADPVANMRRSLVDMGIEPAVIEKIEREVMAEVAASAEEAVRAPEPMPVFTAKRPLPAKAADRLREYRGDTTAPPVTMAVGLRETLRHQLRTDDRVILFGEDIEDPKGDVFGVTRGLSGEFPGRVRNSALSESTIVGVSIGQALAGARPVAFLQFADFLPLAFNQIVSELASLYWRTAGAWQAPVIILISCGGYRPGLGPFHSQTLESVATHLPGVDVVMPATAGDAAGLLNAAFDSARPTLFFYPKSCLNLIEQSTSSDVHRQFVPLGTSRLVRTGRDITFVSWGYPIFLCEKAAIALAEAGVEAEVLDLRSLSPWDEAAVLASAEKTGRLIVVHEDNHTCGFGAEVLATVAEKARRAVQCRRVARPDTWVPCHFPSQLEVLPSFQRVLTVATELLDLELTWETEPAEETGTITVNAIGSGPADEMVIVTEILVQVGAAVSAGDVIAIAEATKSIVEISACAAGTVEEVLIAAGDDISVGKPIVRIRPHSAGICNKAVALERVGRPMLRRKAIVTVSEPPPQNGTAGHSNGRTQPVAMAMTALPPDSSPSHSHAHESQNGNNGHASAGNGHPLSRSAVPLATFREVPISPRQRLLNRRMESALRTVPQGAVTHALAWDRVLAAAERLRHQYPGLKATEFDVLAFCVAQSATASPRVRSVLVGEATLREYRRLNLGIAVHLPGDDLTTAVVRGADRMSFPEFVRNLHAQIEQAQSGEDQASHDTQLLISYLGGLPITHAVPLVIPPAAGVLFVGAPQSSATGSTVNITFAFDHRILNGVAAARFIRRIIRQLGQLRKIASASSPRLKPSTPAAPPTAASGATGPPVI